MGNNLLKSELKSWLLCILVLQRRPVFFQTASFQNVTFPTQFSRLNHFFDFIFPDYRLKFPDFTILVWTAISMYFVNYLPAYQLNLPIPGNNHYSVAKQTGNYLVEIHNSILCFLHQFCGFGEC